MKVSYINKYQELYYNKTDMVGWSPLPGEFSFSLRILPILLLLITFLSRYRLSMILTHFYTYLNGEGGTWELYYREECLV